jgi:large subunit ribosomal protein L10
LKKEFENWSLIIDKLTNMVPQQKINQVKDLSDKLERAKAVYLVDYQGLSGNQMVELREEIRKAGGSLQIAKNTLLKKAMTEEYRKQKTEFSESITGPTAVLWAEEDQMSPLKAVVKFAKQAGVPELKLGLMEDRVLTAEEVNELAKLPGLEVLRGQVVGMLQSPTSRLVGVLRGNLQKLAIVLTEIQKQKGS